MGVTTNVPLTDSDKALLEQVFNFAGRNAPEGVYIGQFYSRSLSAPVCIVVAMGDQAMAIQSILMGAAVDNEAAAKSRFDAEGGDNGIIINHNFRGQ